MKIRLLLTLCCVLCLSDDVLAEGGSEIKKGHYPFMAFIYYPDETIIESTGLRFLRGAVLVKPEWLITSSVGPVIINDTPIGFPRKTLLARLGSVTIDANFTLNEDEDEQEREIIQIVRPYNISEAQWWRNDITLAKTLLPFNLTAVVGTATIRTRPGVIGNSNCIMLVYAVTKKFGNWTEERVLMQLFVELQPSSRETCGSHFYEETMLCATDSDESKSIAYDSEFCQGNSGGPLICENEVAGLQTYIENNCKQPHLYQLLSAWDNFITCGIENKCNEEHCGNMCTLVNKDEPATEDVLPSSSEEPTVQTSNASAVTQTERITMMFNTSPELITEEFDTPTQLPTLTPVMEQKINEDTTTTTTGTTVVTEVPTTTTPITVTTTVPTTFETVKYEETESPSWPKDKYPERAKIYEEEEIKMDRKANMEAQQHDVIVPTKTKTRSAAERAYVSLSLLVQFVLASLIV